MNIMKIRHVLIAVAMIPALGIGISACGKSTDTDSDQSRSESMTSAISDTAMTAQVKAKMMTESKLRGSDISVTTNNAVVTLEGTVSDPEARSVAERAARSIDGVRGVQNNLNTSGGSGAMEGAQRVMSDTWITTKVKSEILADSLSKGFDVSVDTKEGIVTLEGALKDQEAIDHVTEIAAGVEGVKRVDASALTVDTEN